MRIPEDTRQLIEDLVPQLRDAAGGRFFVPTDEFADWLVSYAGTRLVFEPGCGECDLLRALRDRGCRAFGADPYRGVPRDLISSFIPLRAETSKVTSTHDMLIVVARPDHSGWFAEVLEKIHETSEVLYIGYERNLIYDIPVEFNATQVDAPQVGRHRVWRIERQEIANETPIPRVD